MSFSDLKSRKGRSNTKKLAEEAAKLSKPGGSFDDDRFWKPDRDKSDNGFAIIRFLPASQGENIPWVRVFSHGIKGPTGKWYIENCPTTLQDECPACKSNGELWNSGIEAKKDLARKRKRRLQYISNVYVVSDPKHPENEGKVFLYKYGVKIFTKLMDAMDPSFEDEAAVNAFCFWEGADFKIKIRNVKGFVNYDKSEFAAPTQLLGGNDEDLETLYATQHALQPFVAPDQFKSYEVLETHLKSVLTSSGRGSGTTAADSDNDSEAAVASAIRSESLPAVDETETPAEPVAETVAVGSDDDGDGETSNAKSYFQELADEE